MISCVIIPTAKLASKSLSFEFGDIPPVLVPLGGISVLQHMAEYYRKQKGEFHLHLLTYEKAADIENYVKKLHGKYPNIYTHKLDKLRTLGYTIKQGVEKIKTDQYDRFLIQFGDTLLREPLPLINQDWFLYARKPEAFRWTTFEKDNDKLKKIQDKENIESARPKNIFIGFFSIQNIKEYADMITELDSKNTKLDSFYSGLSKYFELKKYKMIQTDAWLDIGHIDNYYDAKGTLINSREFNSIKINKKRGTVTKTSSNKKGLRDEIRWYLKVPKKFKPNTPRIYDYSLDSKKPQVELEYYSVSDLGEIFTHGNRNLGSWQQCFGVLFETLKDMRLYELEQATIKDRKEALFSMYIDKTKDRLELLRRTGGFDEWFLEKRKINGKKYKSLNYYIDNIEQLVKVVLMSDIPEFTFIHGDLCLANILYNNKNRTIKMIDPRGRFGKYQIYGDPRYDLAKLLHSFHGKYEFIIHDRFKMIESPGEIQFDFFTTENSQKAEKLFLNYLKNHCGKKIKQIYLIEALLYLSMTPLHKDNVNRQKVMLSQGIKFFDQILKSTKL